MRSPECSAPELQPAGWVGRDGTLWFTTRKGVVVVDPSRLADFFSERGNPREAEYHRARAAGP